MCRRSACSPSCTIRICNLSMNWRKKSERWTDWRIGCTNCWWIKTKIEKLVGIFQILNSVVLLHINWKRCLSQIFIWYLIGKCTGEEISVMFAGMDLMHPVQNLDGRRSQWKTGLSKWDLKISLFLHKFLSCVCIKMLFFCLKEFLCNQIMCDAFSALVEIFCKCHEIPSQGKLYVSLLMLLLFMIVELSLTL